MATPIITATQTVLAWAVRQEFSFQFNATGSPTSWSVAPGYFLPNGVLLDIGQGRIYGAGTIAGVWDLKFIASNADGNSDPMLFTVGIFDLPQEKDVAKVAVINTNTWAVSLPDPFAVEGSKLAAAGGVRYGDLVTFQLRFEVPGTGEQFPKLQSARFSLKGLDVEPAFFVTDEWSYVNTVVFDGSRYVRRYFVNVDFSNEGLSAFLADYEADGGTSANCLCEFEFIFTRYPGAGPGVNRITTQPFLLRVQRDTIK
ncbi:MAG: hypothetical protein EBY32_13585 [Proteobacteria bacterium]|nr:hypothetical protein [Pseudomonadota bacterium]